MNKYSYHIDPRPANLGGGYQLRFIENDEEIGGGVFPFAAYNEYDDAEQQSIAAYADAYNEGEAWLSSRNTIQENVNQRVEKALQGLISVDDLNGDEQEDYLDRFDESLSAPSPQMDAFFKDRQERGLGVGMDEAGNIIEQKPV
jgi:hypothetical protein